MAIITFGFCLSLNAESTSPMTILRNFNEPPREAPWYARNDDVMGGVSDGQAEIKGGHLHFAGELSLENNGGFAQVYSPVEQSDLSQYAGIRLRVKGDGRAYQFRLATHARFRGSRIAYRSSFSTKAGEWMEIFLPFSSFVPGWRGNILSGPPLDLTSVQQIALLLADGNPGRFSLIVDCIGAGSGRPE